MLLLGRSVDKPFLKPPEAREFILVMQCTRITGAFFIEHGRYWQAEYWISATRDYALQLTCLRRKLPASQARGFDNSPPEIHQVFNRTFVVSLTREELMRALSSVIDGPLYEVNGFQALSLKVKPQLGELTTEWNT
jgi:hypothetical protein